MNIQEIALVEVQRRLEEHESQGELLRRIQAALNTEESGDNLVEVVECAHNAELAIAYNQGAAYVMHSDWDSPRFFTAKDPDAAWDKAVKHVFGLVAKDREEFEKINGSVSDDQWLESLLDGDWDIDSGIISEEN